MRKSRYDGVMSFIPMRPDSRKLNQSMEVDGISFPLAVKDISTWREGPPVSRGLRVIRGRGTASDHLLRVCQESPAADEALA